MKKVDNNSMKGEYNNKRNKTDNETANGNKEMSIAKVMAYPCTPLVTFVRAALC